MSGDNPTGFPVWGSAVEGSPVEFFANTFGPLSAFNADGQLIGNMTYTWQFQQTVCNLGCLQVNVGGPDYTAPIASTGVTYYTFPTSGTYAVQLTATDSTNGDQAVDDFSVAGWRCAAHTGAQPGLPGRPVRRRNGASRYHH